MKRRDNLLIPETLDEMLDTISSGWNPSDITLGVEFVADLCRRIRALEGDDA